MKTKNNKIQKGGQEEKPIPITDDSNTLSSNKPTELPIKRIPYDIKIFSFFCILGLVIRMIFAKTTNDYAKATVYGYGFSIFALLGLLVSSFALSYKDQFAQGIVGFFKVVFKNAIPVILIISIVALVIFQNVSFYEQINSGKVADEYYQFSGVSSFLILVQTVLVINYLMDILAGTKKSSNNDKAGIMTAMAGELNSIILILSVANISIIGILQVILKYFSTDG